MPRDLEAEAKDREAKVCTRCETLRESDRFPKTPQGRRCTVCVFCRMAENEPVPCNGCGRCYAPSEFPRRANGRRASVCHACKSAPQRPRVCAGCDKLKPVAEFARYSSGQFSRSCDACRVVLHSDRQCMRCKKVLPHHSFHTYRSGSKAASCHDCRRERPNGPKGANMAPRPCKVCGGEIWFDEPPSRLAQRRCCSKLCELASRRRNDRTCLRCKRTLPFTAFGRNDVGRNRKSSCHDCLETDSQEWRGDLVLRPTVAAFRGKLKHQANLRGVKFTITLPQARKMHRSPCELCGKAVSSVVLRDVKEGYTLANCRLVCRLCKRVLNILDFAELLLLGNEIGAHSPLDLTKHGWERCRSTKRKALPSSSAGSEPSVKLELLPSPGDPKREAIA